MRALVLVALTALISFWIPTAHAFDQDKCGDLFPRVDDKYPPYYSPLYTFTMFPSTTSYVSSWGKCSMYGDTRAIERNKFVASEYEQISREAAQGGGESVATLASLSGCPSEKKVEFSHALQSQFTRVFKGPRESQPEAFGSRVDDVIKSHTELSKSCVL